MLPCICSVTDHRWHQNVVIVSRRLSLDFITQSYSCNQQSEIFVTSNISGDVKSKQTCDDKKAPVRNQRSDNSVRRQLGQLSRKLENKRAERSDITSSQKIVNQQCLVYHFRCDLCDADYVCYTCRHLYQHIEEHKGSAIRKLVRHQQGRDPSDISLTFNILRKCQRKFDCLIYEMLFTKELKLTLNKQSDSIRAKLFL